MDYIYFEGKRIMIKKIMIKSLFLLLLTVTFIGCIQKLKNNNSYNNTNITEDHKTSDLNEMPKILPTDFQIIFTFGVEQANQHDGINTQDGTIQKDLVLDGLAISNIKVNEENLKEIYNLLKEIDIISYPNNYKPPYMENPPEDTIKYVTPSNVYNVWIKYDDKEYSLYWHDTNASEIEEANILRDALEEIKKIIRSFEAYKDLGEPNGGYD